MNDKNSKTFSAKILSISKTSYSRESLQKSLNGFVRFARSLAVQGETISRFRFDRFDRLNKKRSTEKGNPCVRHRFFLISPSSSTPCIQDSHLLPSDFSCCKTPPAHPALCAIRQSISLRVAIVRITRWPNRFSIIVKNTWSSGIIITVRIIFSLLAKD